MVSGCLIVAYVAGNILSKFQLLFVTALFVSFAYFFTLGSFGYFRGAHNFMTRWEPETYDGGYITYAYWILTAQILRMLGSLIFMYQAQKSHANT